MSQPAVTNLLSDLEKLLEVQLFHRHARGVRATSVGGDIVPVAARMLEMLGGSAELVAARIDRGTGTVRVAASPAAIGGLFARALPPFSKEYPEIQIQLAEAGAQDVPILVSRRDVDMVGCRQPAVIPEGWASKALVDDG
jgi:DNA-binding transcriptional LysR family regulator